MEVRKLKKPQVSTSQATVKIAGTTGWAETLPYIFHKTETGEVLPVTARVEIRHKNRRSEFL